MPRDGHPVETQARFDTGHRMDNTLDPDTGDWTTYVTHDSDPKYNRLIQVSHGDLGGDHSRLGEAVVSALRHPQVMQSMREQMQHGGSPQPAWLRQFGQGHDWSGAQAPEW